MAKYSLQWKLDGSDLFEAIKYVFSFGQKWIFKPDHGDRMAE